MLGIVVIGQDVTRLRESEARLRKYADEHHDQLRRSFDLSHDLVRQVDLSGDNLHHYYISPSFKSVLGHEPESLLGDARALSQLFPKMHLERISMLKKRILSNSESFIEEGPLLHADGHEVLFEHRVNRHPDSNEFAVIISRDLTQRLERQRLE